MSDAHFTGGTVHDESRRPVVHDRPSNDLPLRSPIGTPAPLTMRAWRDTGTEFLSSGGILALAALETMDVVGRAAGKLGCKATLDASRAGFELFHEVTRTAHDIIVDGVETAVDTVSDVSVQVVRGASMISKQGRELMHVTEDIWRGVAGAAALLMRGPQRAGSERPVAVPIVVN